MTLIMEARCVFFDVGTEFLNIIHVNFVLQRVNKINVTLSAIRSIEMSVFLLTFNNNNVYDYDFASTSDDGYFASRVKERKEANDKI
jgi:hypothetical protein